MVAYEDCDIVGFDAGGGEILKYQGQFLTGFIVENHPNNNLASSEEFKNGHRDGVQRSYHENGVLAEEYFVRFNKYYGIAKEWSENGDLVDEYDYGPLS